MLGSIVRGEMNGVMSEKTEAAVGVVKLPSDFESMT